MADSLLRPGNSDKKRIREPLHADRGVRTVPAVNERGVGQWQKDPLQGCQQCRRVTAGEIGAADGTVEEHVSTEHGPVAHKADTAG